jgi:methyltransferase
MVSKICFLAILLAIVCQRIAETRISKHNLAYLLAQGGRQHNNNYLVLVKIMHLSWFLAMGLEVFLLARPFIWLWAIIGLSGAIAGQYLRYLSMRALKWRWTLPITTLPHTPAINEGVYRYIRHPNWLGVIIELATTPLIHGAYLTAILFSLTNALVMYKRIQAEEQALSLDNDYAKTLKHRPRFIPNLKKN